MRGRGLIVYEPYTSMVVVVVEGGNVVELKKGRLAAVKLCP